MNNCNFIGRMAKDPELTPTKTNKPLLNFSLAVKRRGSDEPNWVNFEAWDKQAELICSYVRKGQQLAVSSYVKIDKATDDTKRTFTKFVVTDLTLLGGKQEGSPAPARPAAPAVDDFDDIPF